MCQNCNNNSCGGCYQQCPPYPPQYIQGPPGQVGPIGPQGPAGPAGASIPCPCPLNIVKVTGLSQLALAYNVTGLEDVILVNSTLGLVDIFLLPANDPLVQNRKLVIKDAFGTSGVFDITVQAGADTIDTVPGATSMFATLGSFGSMELVTNQINGYNII